MSKVIRRENREDETKYDMGDVPIFKECVLVETEELLTAEWPKRATIRARAILAVACRLGALDFSTGERINSDNIQQRHYHHIYPDALLKEAGIGNSLALNCALISDKTNISIGRQDPVNYMTKRYEWTSKELVSERLLSHLIPIPELANGGYESLSKEEKIEKLKRDFDAFISRRAELVMKAVQLLADGRQLSVAEVYEE